MINYAFKGKGEKSLSITHDRRIHFLIYLKPEQMPPNFSEVLLI